MKQACKYYWPKSEDLREFCPSVMAGFTTDTQTVYFHSSVKGAGRTTNVLDHLSNSPGQPTNMYVSSAVNQFVTACMNAGNMLPGHINSAACAEIMAINYWSVWNSYVLPAGSPTMWIYAATRDGEELPPCGGAEQMQAGCYDIVTALGLTVCRNYAYPYDPIRYPYKRGLASKRARTRVAGAALNDKAANLPSGFMSNSCPYKPKSGGAGENQNSKEAKAGGNQKGPGLQAIKESQDSGGKKVPGLKQDGQSVGGKQKAPTLK